jgi:hypothetical protein
MHGMAPRALGAALFLLDPAGLYFAISPLTTIADGGTGLQTRFAWKPPAVRLRSGRF